MSALSKHGLLVIASSPGRLGNRLIHFAHHLAFAYVNRYPLMHLGFGDYKHYFSATARKLIPTYPSCEEISHHELTQFFVQVIKDVLVLTSKKGGLDIGVSEEILEHFSVTQFLESQLPVLTGVVEKLCFNLPILVESGVVESPVVRVIRGDSLNDHNLFHLSIFSRELEVPMVLLLDSWESRAPDCIQQAMPMLREYFSLVPELQRSLDNFFVTLPKDDAILIGVHIRRTDYKEFEGGKYFFSFEDYANLLRKIQDQLSGVQLHFIICSDAEVPFELFSGIHCVPGPGDEILDMHALSRCSAMIGPPSTFTGWAAFLYNTPFIPLTGRESFEDSDRLVEQIRCINLDLTLQTVSD